MTTHRGWFKGAVVVVLLLGMATPAAAADIEGQDAQAAFFAGLDLKEAGDCEGAVARFQLALGRDPELYQARLHMAECYHSLGLDEEAITELVVYLSTRFPGMEEARARDLLATCGGDPDSVVVGEVVGDEGAGEGSGGDGEDGGGAVPGGAAGSTEWAPVRLEVGGRFQHYANRIGLNAGGPVVGVRVLPVGFLELGVDGAFGLGGYPDHDGIVQVPVVSFSACASIPVKRVRVLAGVVVPLVMSRFDGTLRADPGVLGEVGVRVAVGSGRLVVGGQVSGGYVVQPTVGGGVTLGIQLGPLGGAR